MSGFSYPAYLINLDRHPERRAASIGELKAVAMDFTRIEAVDYRQLDDQAIRSVVDTAPRAPVKHGLSPGEVACFLSHIKVWRQIARGSAEMAWVFEDDVSFATDARETMLAIESRERDWDMLRLFCPKPIEIEDVEPLHGRYSMALSRKYPMSTIAYAITRQAADHLAKTMLPFSLPVDMALKFWWVHGLCTRIVTPNLCQPRNDAFSASTLDSQRELHKASRAYRFAANLRYQFHLARMRRIHADAFPRKSRFS